LIKHDSFDVHWLEGSIRFRRGDIRNAIQSFERAMELDPNSADAAALLAYSYLLAGRGDRARSVSDLLVALDPLTPLFQCMPGICDLMEGLFDAAIVHYRRFFDMDGANPAAHFFLAWVLAMSGRKAEAIAAADTLVATFPASAFGQLGNSYALAFRGDIAGARALVSPEMRASAVQSEMFSRLIADLHAQTGDHDAAVDAISASVGLGFANYPYLADHAVLLAPVRNHPRYLTLLDEVRIRWEQGGASVGGNHPSPSSLR
jgi:Flp pilus assembly protein TadD